jgi:hypothetical protein
LAPTNFSRTGLVTGDVFGPTEKEKIAIQNGQKNLLVATYLKLDGFVTKN